MPWQEQNPLNALLGNIVGGLAANRQAQTEAMMRQYQLQRQQQLDADKHSLDQSEIGKNTAEGTRAAAQTTHEQNADKADLRKSGFTADGQRTWQPVKVPVGDGKAPPPIDSVTGAYRENANRARTAGDLSDADSLDKAAASIAAQYSAVAHANAAVRHNEILSGHYNTEEAIQREQMRNAIGLANIRGHYQVQAAGQVAGGIMGAAGIRSTTQVSEGAKNRDFRAERDNVNNAYNYDLRKLGQDRTDQRFNSGQANKSLNQSTYINSKNSTSPVTPYNPTTPQDFGPTPAPLPADSSEDDGDYFTKSLTGG